MAGGIYSWGAIRGSRFRIWRNGRPIAIAERRGAGWHLELKFNLRVLGPIADMAAAEVAIELQARGLERRWGIKRGTL